MTKTFGIKLFSAAASLAIVWGCMQVDSNTEDRAQSSNFSAANSMANKLVAAQKSAVLAKAASVSKTQDACTDNLLSCTNIASSTYYSCLSTASTTAQQNACLNAYSSQTSACQTQYDACVDGGTDPNPTPTPTPNITALPAACASFTEDSHHSEDLAPCFQALGICQGFINILTDVLSCDETCEANPPASFTNLINCAVSSDIDTSQEVDPLTLFTNSALNTCLCGAGGGTLFGNILQTTFNPSSSNTAPNTFNPLSSTIAPSTFSPSSSTTAPSTFNPSSSQTAENTFSP